MYITWEEAKEMYRGKWVALKNPTYSDMFHLRLIGGFLMGTSDNADDAENLVPMDDFDNDYVCRHTEEESAVGLHSCFINII
jgi:hypothetical protein